MTPFADMIEQMLINNAPISEIVVAVRGFDIASRDASRSSRDASRSSRDASRTVTQEQNRIRALNYRNRKKSQQVAKANDVATSGEAVTVPAVTRHACFLEGPYNSIKEDSVINRKEEESKKLVVVRARAARMPAGAPLANEFTMAALGLGADRDAIPKIWAEFVDYWCAVPGVRGTKLDWLATWRNRVRQISSRGNPNGKASHATDTLGGFSGFATKLRRKIAEQEADDDAGGPQPVYRR